MEPRVSAGETTTLVFPALYPSNTCAPIATNATFTRECFSQRHNRENANAVFTDAAFDGFRLALAWYKPSTKEAWHYECTLNHATPTQANFWISGWCYETTLGLPSYIRTHLKPCKALRTPKQKMPWPNASAKSSRTSRGMTLTLG